MRTVISNVYSLDYVNIKYLKIERNNMIIQEFRVNIINIQ